MRKNKGKVAKYLVMKKKPDSKIAERYRMVRTNIEYVMKNEGLKTIACTSTKSGEGKTTTISNLAVSIANQGKKVLLVDSNLRNPNIHNIFDIENQLGLTDILKEGISPTDIFVKTEVKGLFIIPSGPRVSNPSELLGSIIMKHFLEEISEYFDIILLDTPATLEVTDAQILGNICDGILFIVKSNSVEIDELHQAKNLLKKTNIKVVGSVLTGVDCSLRKSKRG